MCPLSPAPDAIFVPWPWEAPWNWLGFAAFFAFLVWALFIRRPRQWFDNRYIRTAGPIKLNLARAGSIISFVVLSIGLVAIVPSMQRNDAWYSSQFARFSQQSCNLGVLFTTAAHSQQTMLAWVFGMLGANLLAAALLIYANLRPRD